MISHCLGTDILCEQGHKFKAHEWGVTCLTLYQDSAVIISGSADETLQSHTPYDGFQIREDGLLSALSEASVCVSSCPRLFEEDLVSSADLLKKIIIFTYRRTYFTVWSVSLKGTGGKRKRGERERGRGIRRGQGLFIR